MVSGSNAVSAVRNISKFQELALSTSCANGRPYSSDRAWPQRGNGSGAPDGNAGRQRKAHHRQFYCLQCRRPDQLHPQRRHVRSDMRAIDAAEFDRVEQSIDRDWSTQAAFTEFRVEESSKMADLQT